MYFDLQATATFVALFWIISGLFFITGKAIYSAYKCFRSRGAKK